MGKVQLRCVFDSHDPVQLRNHAGQALQKGGLACGSAASNGDVELGSNSNSQKVGDGRCDGAQLDQGSQIPRHRTEAPDGRHGSLDVGHDGRQRHEEPRAVGQPCILVRVLGRDGVAVAGLDLAVQEAAQGISAAEDLLGSYLTPSGIDDKDGARAIDDDLFHLVIIHKRCQRPPTQDVVYHPAG